MSSGGAEPLRLPAGYDPAPLVPVVEISDRSFRPAYRYEHPRISDDPVQDFSLRSWSLHLGINSDAGSCDLDIQDDAGVLVDDAGSCVIRPGYIIRIILGKSADTGSPWFTGIVTEPAVVRPGVITRTVRVKAEGYAATLRSRTVNVDYMQETDGSGLPVDDDETALIPNLVRRVVADDAWQVIPPADNTITHDGIADDIIIKLASLRKQYQRQDAVIAELAGASDAVYGVTPDLDFYFHGADRRQDAVATNDPRMIAEAGAADTEAATGLMILAKSPYKYRDSVVNDIFSDLIGTNITFRSDRLTPPAVADAARPLDHNSAPWHGYVIGTRQGASMAPYSGQIPAGSLGVRLRRTAEVSGELTYRITAYGGGGEAAADDHLLDSGRISADTVNRLPLNEDAWLDLRNPEIHAGGTGLTSRVVWFGGISGLSVTGSDSPGLTSDVHYYETRSESQTSPGDLWAAVFRVIETKDAVIIATNVSARRDLLPRQVVRSFPDAPATSTATTLFEGVLGRAGETRRTYSGIRVLAPRVRPRMGERFRLRDVYGRIDRHVLLNGMEVRQDRPDGGATHIVMHAEDVVT